MNPHTWDNLALGLALGAVVMRLLDRPWSTWCANVLSSLTLAAAVTGQRAARRRVPPWS
jgi:hypothetical protein